MSDLDQSDYEVVFESQLKSRVLNKSIARLMALIPNSANEQRDVVIFAIEDIVFLEQIRRRIGTPKVWLWNLSYPHKFKHKLASFSSVSERVV